MDSYGVGLQETGFDSHHYKRRKQKQKRGREGWKKRKTVSFILNMNTHTYIMCDKISHEVNQYLVQSTLQIVCSAKL